MGSQDPHGIPSGGDWTLERSAALFIQDAERVTVSGCVFERIDGNSILMSAYTRNTTITYNEFYMLGGTAIASWGNTDGGDPRLPAGYGQDGSAGNQPRGSYIGYNWASHIGIWEKQSSFYFQAKSGLNTLEAVSGGGRSLRAPSPAHSRLAPCASQNVVFVDSRAAINFNDGFLGGSRLTRNFITTTW